MPGGERGGEGERERRRAWMWSQLCVEAPTIQRMQPRPDLHCRHCRDLNRSLGGSSLCRRGLFPLWQIILRGAAQINDSLEWRNRDSTKEFAIPVYSILSALARSRGPSFSNCYANFCYRPRSSASNRRIGVFFFFFLESFVSEKRRKDVW